VQFKRVAVLTDRLLNRSPFILVVRTTLAEVLSALTVLILHLLARIGQPSLDLLPVYVDVVFAVTIDLPPLVLNFLAIANRALKQVLVLFGFTLFPLLVLNVQVLLRFTHSLLALFH